jgi:hypothetical protein
MSSIAYRMATLITAYCEQRWGDALMASTMADHFAEAGDGAGYGSHKYIPADEYTIALGEPLGAGVFGYWRYSDSSVMLLTCRGPVGIVDHNGCRWAENPKPETIAP